MYPLTERKALCDHHAEGGQGEIIWGFYKQWKVRILPADDGFCGHFQARHYFVVLKVILSCG